MLGFEFLRRRGRGRKGPVGFAAGLVLAPVAGLFLAAPAAAEGWRLDPSASSLTYQSVKKNSIVETNTIRNISGDIAEDGRATVRFDLNSVDTGVDLRNVRMRFLFFETFKFPEAVLTATVDPALFADLPTRRRMTHTLPFRLDLHGIAMDMQTDVVVTMITEGMVAVSSSAPIFVKAEDFGLLPGIEKLEQAANVTNIVPTASVSFDLVFTTGEIGEASQVVAEAAAPAAAPQAVSAEPAAVVAEPAVVAAPVEVALTGPVITDAAKATYTDEECFNRFEVLSRTGAIFFRTGSAELDELSRPVLGAVLDVVGKCPRLQVEVSGHTDSDGSDGANQTLSERRAAAVADYIARAGIPPTQIAAKGYGELRPIVPNDSDKNKALNRRIEFAARPID
ncbi:MAG TPA: OmpA family protein [Methylomirabilota bacterium]|nr:OmpA family protein [Methylomirabilota bacterium]